MCRKDLIFMLILTPSLFMLIVYIKFIILFICYTNAKIEVMNDVDDRVNFARIVSSNVP
jgi:hypothetical protein